MTQRMIYGSAILLTACLLITSGYLQFYQGVQPCPLCILQRFCFAALGLLFVVNFLLSHQIITRLLNFICLLISALGMLLAGRQIWLQHALSQTNSGGECGVSLQYLWHVLSFSEMIQRIFAGGLECSQRNGEFLYMDTAEWSALWFSIFFLLSFYLLWIDKSRR